MTPIFNFTATTHFHTIKEVIHHGWNGESDTETGLHVDVDLEETSKDSDMTIYVTPWPNKKLGATEGSDDVRTNR